MPAYENRHFQLPDWYRTERETEKTIQKLNSLKELEYYLQNPDEFIRRLAILRLQKLSPKEAVYVLKEIFDSPAETHGNKYIAGWILNTLLKGKDDVLFMGNRYSGKFTGSERYEELFPVFTEKGSGSVYFNFESSPSHSVITLDKEDTILERDVYFESEFDFKQWFKTFMASASSNLRKSLLALPAAIIKLLKNVFTRLSECKKNKPVKIKKRHKNEQVSTSAENRRAKPADSNARLADSRTGSYSATDSYYSLRNELYKKQNFFTYVKKGAFQLFYGLFFPVRFVRKHKFAAFVMLLTVWLLLANTNYGRAFTTKYFSIDLKTTQTVVLQKLEVCTSYLSNGFNRMTGMDEWNKERDSSDTTSAQASANIDLGSVSKDILYTVNAKKGLNMRVSPDPGSGRVGDGPLEFGSTVAYLDKQKKDKSGITWYYIEAADGRTGWVSSRYLKEKEG
ncbi:MAG TPA: SH3 domain-containing protein [Clostridia bacterium]|nr:SH3 domain-containing protein [Clostridia bacterium]